MISHPITRARPHSSTRRTAHGDLRQRRIESLAAEFALLAQRRARVVHQMDLLDQQHAAAAAGFARLQNRMVWLAQRIDILDPGLRSDDTATAAHPTPRFAPSAAAPSPPHPANMLPSPMRLSRSVARVASRTAPTASAPLDDMLIDDGPTESARRINKGRISGGSTKAGIPLAPGRQWFAQRPAQTPRTGQPPGRSHGASSGTPSATPTGIQRRT